MRVKEKKGVEERSMKLHFSFVQTRALLMLTG